MTSANPPYPYFNGITYNSQYFASSGSSLTQSQANALYLRKTTADTATALETFSGGIAMGTGMNITLQPIAEYVAPTPDIMLGGLTTGSFVTPAISFNVAKDIATISLVKGTHIVSFTFQANYTTLPSTNYILLTGTVLPLPDIAYGATTMAAGVIGISGSFPISVTTAGTIILRYTISGSSITSITRPVYNAVRIA